MRELVWMAKAKREHDGHLMAWELGHVLSMLSTEPLDIDALNPFKPPQPEIVKSPERLALENKTGWDLIHRAWGGETVKRIRERESI